MAVILVRIDDRLVHGQIVEGWLKNVAVDKIALASDFVARDDMQKLLMRLAVPPTIELEIKTVDEVAKNIIGGVYEKSKTMIIASKPSEVLYMVERGAGFKSVNVGGMHYEKDKRQVLPNVFVDDIDIAALRALGEKNIELEGRILPLDERTDVFAAIRGIS